jgi:cytochrome d ubiquinol oxidase subunit I
MWIVAVGTTLSALFTTRYQPMKMAAAEALYRTARPAALSLLTIGNLNGTKPVFEITLPRLLSFLGTGNWNGKVQGIDNLQAFYRQVYGPGSYTPIIPVTYWSFRLMIGIGLVAALVTLIALWRYAAAAPPVPGAAVVGDRAAAPAAGRVRVRLDLYRDGPPALAGLRADEDRGRGSANSGGEVLASMLVLTVLYGVLSVIEAGLLLRSIRRGLAAGPGAGEHGGEAETPALVY